MRIFVLSVVFLCSLVEPALAQHKHHHAGCHPHVHPTSDRVGIFTAGELAGHRLGDLYAAYIGVENIGPKVTVDPARQLDSMWLVKEACYHTASVVEGLHHGLLASYRAKRSAMTLGEFVGVADHEISTAQGDIDWDKFQSLYHLSVDGLAVAKKLSGTLSGRDFVAYGMTELMPTADGELNLDVLEFLVRNYGPEFVYRIPAMSDKYASFGFFQFTSFAVNGGTKHPDGASLASLALKRNPLPGSTKDVQGPLQFRAAYLFAMNNIARLTKNLSKQELAVLGGLNEANHDDLIQFIAAAHTSPAVAQKAARRWLDNKMRAEFYVSVGNHRVREYAVKTKNNLLALRSHKNLTGVLYGAR